MRVNSTQQLNYLVEQITADICAEFGFDGWAPVLPIEKATDYPRAMQKHVCRINGKVELQALPIRTYAVPYEYAVDKLSGETYVNYSELQVYVCPFCGKIILVKDEL